MTEDDDYDGPDDYPCDCLDADLDWDGEFHCYSCGHRWDATQEQMARYWASYDDAHRAPTLRECLEDWWCGIGRRIRDLVPRKRQVTDDDIPF